MCKGHERCSCHVRDYYCDSCGDFAIAEDLPEGWTNNGFYLCPACSKGQVKHPTLEDKVRVYESLLHSIQFFSEVTMDQKAFAEAVEKICRWSYAHRAGNGQYSDEEQQRLIDKAFWKLEE